MVLDAGDTGLEIAPGSEAENAEALIADPGNIWNGVPQVLPCCAGVYQRITLCCLRDMHIKAASHCLQGICCKRAKGACMDSHSLHTLSLHYSLPCCLQAREWTTLDCVKGCLTGEQYAKLICPVLHATHLLRHNVII